MLTLQFIMLHCIRTAGVYLVFYVRYNYDGSAYTNTFWLSKPRVFKPYHKANDVTARHYSDAVRMQ